MESRGLIFFYWVNLRKFNGLEFGRNSLLDLCENMSVKEEVKFLSVFLEYCFLSMNFY